MGRVRKAVGSALGAATGAGVVLGARWVGLEVEPELAAAIALILATFGTWVAPPNDGPAPARAPGSLQG